LFPPTRETRLRPEADAGILYDAFHTIDVRCRQVVTEHCVEGIRADEKRIGDLMELAADAGTAALCIVSGIRPAGAIGQNDTPRLIANLSMCR